MKISSIVFLTKVPMSNPHNTPRWFGISCRTILVANDGDENSTPVCCQGYNIDNMMWPFILNTVSPWPSVRKWLLILALNLTACQCEERSSRGLGWRELGPSRPLTQRSTRLPSSLPYLPPPHSVSPGGAFSLGLQIKQLLVPLFLLVCVRWVKMRAVSMQTHRFAPLAAILFLEVGNRSWMTTRW